MLLALLLASPAHATWSIVVADPATGITGGAGTSCVGTLDVGIIHGVAPGKGAVHAQAALNVAGRDEAVRLLEAETPPADVIAAITDPGFDSAAQRRQYGVVDMFERAEGFTGDLNGDWAGHTTGVVGGVVYSVQGNILTGPEVVDRTVAAFEASADGAREDACDLPERLLEALTAGRAEGEGDSRCTPRGVPSDSAFVRVTDNDGTVIVDLTVTGTGTADPLDALAEELRVWRIDHACIELPEPDTDDDADRADAGCGCASGGGAGWVALIGGLGLVLRRRRGSGSRA